MTFAFSAFANIFSRSDLSGNWNFKVLLSITLGLIWVFDFSPKYFLTKSKLAGDLIGKTNNSFPLSSF